jgi:hypothetical protein
VIKRLFSLWLNCILNFTFVSLLAIADETLAEFLSKATGTAVDWVQMIGMKVTPIELFVILMYCVIFCVL